MKNDAKKLRSLFTNRGFKVGDLVLTGEIHRVVAIGGKYEMPGSIVVVDVVPECHTCRKWLRKMKKRGECSHQRVMKIRSWGQHAAMKLRRMPR